MNLRFRCTECDRLTENFEAALDGPEGRFDGIIQYCHFCDVGFYMLPNSEIELVEIEKPAGMSKEMVSSEITSLAGSTNGLI
ncbi:MAG: hypothetical protein KGI25_00560 [Thaumarchaeota archaeon]|nr:hypothetical protein [Nitrososphaerota archaeon]